MAIKQSPALPAYKVSSTPSLSPAMPPPRPSEDRNSPYAHEAAVRRYEGLRDATLKR